MAYLYQQSGNVDASLRTRSYVLGLDYDPQELIRRLPDTAILIECLAAGPAYMDTRGFIAYKQKRYEEAVRDFDIAIRGTRTLLSSKRIDESKVIQAIEVKQSRRVTEHTQLVLVDHRRRALQKTKSRRALRDRAELKRAGIRPGTQLY